MPAPDKQQDKRVQGRSWDQITNGTTSVGTMGAGSTGGAGQGGERKDQPQRGAEGARQQGDQGSAGRTDDLLSGGAGDEQSDKGFQGKPER